MYLLLSLVIFVLYAAKILVATHRKPKSAIQLSKKHGIPIGICYRRIHKLEEAGFLKEADRVLTQDGKRVSVYESTLKNVHIIFEDGNFRIKMEKKRESADNGTKGWKNVELLER